MSERAIKILRTDLQSHPAVRAWRQLQPRCSAPATVEVLQEAKRQGVYRLGGVGPAGAAVVAKGRARGTLSVERTLHEEILPQLPVPRLRCYGFVEGDDALDWLFSEDAGDVRCSFLSEEHGRLAGRWLGLLHISAARLAIADTLPDRGPKHYLDHLRAAREIIQRNLDNAALDSSNVAVLQAVVSLLDFVETRWAVIEQSCDGMPRTLVHGDFVAQNLRLRTTQQGTFLLPLDWETAGWGVPAADLVQGVNGHKASPDLATYWSIVREPPWELDFAAIRKLADLGVILRMLAAIRWGIAKLSPEWVEQPLSNIKTYAAVLSEALRTTSWEG